MTPPSGWIFSPFRTLDRIQDGVTHRVSSSRYGRYPTICSIMSCCPVLCISLHYCLS
jgi:hypothetical protein